MKKFALAAALGFFCVEMTAQAASYVNAELVFKIGGNATEIISEEDTGILLAADVGYFGIDHRISAPGSSDGVRLYPSGYLDWVGKNNYHPVIPAPPWTPTDLRSELDGGVVKIDLSGDSYLGGAKISLEGYVPDWTEGPTVDSVELAQGGRVVVSKRFSLQPGEYFEFGGYLNIESWSNNNSVAQTLSHVTLFPESTGDFDIYGDVFYLYRNTKSTENKNSLDYFSSVIYNTLDRESVFNIYVDIATSGSVVQVPEPSTYALMLAGLGAVAGATATRARRRASC